MLKKIALAVVVAFVAFLGYVATRPSTYRVERSAVVDASVPVVFAYLNGYAHFAQFSPWQKLDPAMRTTLDGPATGVGARYSWSGDDRVGSGSLTITKIVENQRIEQDLHFTAPFASRAKHSYLLAAEGDKTRVTWALEGENDFLSKLFGVFFDMDAMIGKDFDEGLRNLQPLLRAEQNRVRDEAAAAGAATAPAGAANDNTAPGG